MVSANLAMVIKQAEQLTPEEQAQLVAHLTKARSHTDQAPPRRKWRDVIGTLPYPAVGEDAQAWVSRTRREADDVGDVLQANTVAEAP
jgi:hypothetical protein